jgi:8-oxo-dGTP diphosphatase
MSGVIGHFLGGVGAVIWDEQTGRYLLLRRSAQKDFLSNDWECVAGRVDQGESYTQALRREVQEEIGAQVQIEFIIGLTHFYRGAAVPENELLGVLFGCTLPGDQSIAFGEEHSEMHWLSLEEIDNLLPQEHWLRAVLERAELLRRNLPPQLRAAYWADSGRL